MSAFPRRLSLFALGIALVAVGAWLALRSADPIGDTPPAQRDADAAPQAPELAGRGGPTGEALAVPVHALDGTCTITGFVREESGASLAGVPVELTVEEQAPWTSHRDRLAAAPSASPLVAVTTTTADGAFSFAGAHAHAEYRVRAVPPPPHCPVAAWASTNPHDPRGAVVLVCPEGANLRLRVVDAQGRGLVAHCVGSVLERGVEEGRVRNRLWHGELGTTDAEGRLTVASVPPGRMKVALFVRGSGERFGLPITVPASEEVVLHFEETPGAVVAGRVRDAEGRPVADAWVEVRVRESRTGSGGTTRGVATDAGGAFRVGGLPAGVLSSFVVEAPGFLTRGDAVAEVAVVTGEPRHVEVQLTRSCALEGVVRGPDGEAIAGARVQAASAPTTGGYFMSRTDVTADGTTDARGHYRLDGLPVFRGTVEAEIQGFYTVDEDGAPGGRSFSLPTPGDVRRVDLVLARGVRVTGRVVDVAGRPVPDLEVGVRTRSGSGLYATRRTDAAGRFVCDGLAAGTEWSFYAVTERGRAAEVVLRVEPDMEETEIELLWQEGAEISGQVVYTGDSSEFPGRVQCRSDGRGGPGFSRAWPVAADGTFHLLGIPAGRHELSVVDYNLDANGEAVWIEAEAGRHTEGVVLHARRMGEIAGLVVDPDGVPQGDCWVELRPAEDLHRGRKQERSGDDGHFCFSTVPDVDYAVYVDGREQPGRARVGDVTLRLVRPRREEIVFEGSVRGPDGKPVHRASVRVIARAARGPITTEVIPVREGRFRKAFERRGSAFDLQVHRAFDADGRDLGVRPYEQVDVDPAGGPLDIRLEPGLSLEGRVEGPPAAWFVWRFLRAQRVEGADCLHSAWWSREVELSGDGTFRLAGLDPGRYRLAGAVEAGEDWVPGPAVLAEAGDRDVVVHYLPATAVRGQVTDVDGRPVAGAALHLDWSWESGGDTTRSAFSDAEGRFVLPAVPTGVVAELHVRAPERPLLPARRELTAGEEAGSELAVVLAPGVFVRGTVMNEERRDVGDAMLVAISIPDGASVHHTSVLAGDPHFLLGPLPPGRYRLLVNAGNQWTFDDDIEVEAPADDVRLVVKRASR